ncbi:GerMN domain-containing protein [Brevibacillus choshinensis]|uniref:GerMN domain-containing protein n=1 Tax=Brevibacillus choshinensis TaxID=54911 RepID=UPI002E21D9B6|nr:GerMN domain-containing protein [Brevibacillus choshinensis]MED4754270.1 GerMN domain-containing protein [Brevibacillus choshinensis]MED4782472.1 GerMN domain-containing protein [Brevibacillus choshinensis]
MKRRQMIWMAVLATLLVAGCGQKAEPAPQPTAPAEQNTGSNQPPTTTEPKLTKQSISVYYSDNNLMELQKEEQEISFAEDIEKYKKTLEVLEKPKKADEHVPLWTDFHYHSVTFDKGTLTIDADSKNQYNLGSSGEAMALDALKQTLFQYPEIERIVILEDGKKVESLMGHVEVVEPLTRDK